MHFEEVGAAADAACVGVASGVVDEVAIERFRPVLECGEVGLYLGAGVGGGEG